MRRRLAVAACAFPLGTAAACAHAPPPHGAATVVIVPSPGTPAARPDAPVVVTVHDGRIRSVTLTDGMRPVEGRLSADGTEWWPRWALRPDRSYSVLAT